ncbi:ABC transporter permease [Pseudothermotoga sp.]|nr:ABC transporter permease [Pseudothermotoga sp.]MCX7813468.1 ABC transporter permease [Pseudothermotoga sp.]MDW8139544.1 ABC transporter permease [Pseudothermotoga sp.]
MNIVVSNIVDPAFWYSVLRVSTPLLFAVMAALLSSITGTINIAIEGMMLMSAFWGTIIGAFTRNPWIGLMVGIFSSTILALILAFVHLRLNANLVIAGVAINLLSSGFTVFMLFLLTGEKGTSASLGSQPIPRLDVPLLRDIPFVGKMLNNHNALTYLAIISIFVVDYFIRKTPLGVRMRAVGENPNAAVSVGISVSKMRYLSLILSGIFAGFAGAFLSMGYVSWFARDMTSGRGFIALAAQALGGKSAIFGAFGALLFGIAEAFGFTLQSLRIPSEITNMIPFILTLIVLVIYARLRIKSHSRIQEL